MMMVMMVMVMIEHVMMVVMVVIEHMVMMVVVMMPLDELNLRRDGRRFFVFRRQHV